MVSDAEHGLCVCVCVRARVCVFYSWILTYLYFLDRSPLLLHSLSLRHLHEDFPRANFNFVEIQVIHLCFCGMCFGVKSKNTSPNLRAPYTLFFLIFLLWCSALTSAIHRSWSVHMVWAQVKPLCLPEVSSCCGITCWKDHPSSIELYLYLFRNPIWEHLNGSSTGLPFPFHWSGCVCSAAKTIESGLLQLCSES